MKAFVISCVVVALALLTLVLGCGSSREYAASGSRPGLGTSWGETRESRVRSVAFERDHPERPDALVTLRYDDRQGLRAQAGTLASAWVDGVALADGQVRVRLLDASGRPLSHFSRDGQDYVEGRLGERYIIEVDNRSPDRFEAVATVDGLDVMDGGPGSLDKRGYLVGPFATLRIDGFRRNMAEVAAFRFGTVEDSYAARTGDAGNVGVIAVALFGERGWQRTGRAAEAQRRREAEPFPAGREAYPAASTIDSGQFAAPPPRW